MPVDASEVSRSLVVRPPTSARPAAVVRARQVIEVDVRQQLLDARVSTQARAAAQRYHDHGTTLLGQVPGHGSMAGAGRHDAADGWMVVGRWLTLVAVLGVVAVAFAMVGHLTAR